MKGQRRRKDLPAKMKKNRKSSAAGKKESGVEKVRKRKSGSPPPTGASPPSARPRRLHRRRLPLPGLPLRGRTWTATRGPPSSYSRSPGPSSSCGSFFLLLVVDSQKMILGRHPGRLRLGRRRLLRRHGLPARQDCARLGIVLLVMIHSIFF